MTSWQDEYGSGRWSGGDDPAAGRPRSRREAREAERRAAGPAVDRPPHPSGVVDFEAHDFSAEFAPDQDFAVGDTQDIWRALSRGAEPRAVQDDLAAFRSGVPEAPAATPAAEEGSAMSGELLDRVRDAVLRRNAESQLPPAVRAQRERRDPFAAPFTTPTAAIPAAPSRRELRQREQADQREDGLPAELFAERPRTIPPQEGWPAQPSGFQGTDYEADGYYDEPYAPDPTIAIPLRTAGTGPVAANPTGLPQGFAEPAGDDALTFSSPVPRIAANEHEIEAAPDPAFIEPADPWAAARQGHAAQHDPYALAEQHDPYGAADYADDEEWVDDEPAPQEPAAWTAQPAARFEAPQVGPPSEMTDLAGFEALIRKARQQPAEAPAPAPRPGLAWAEDEQEVQEGFTGLLSRQVQGSHGSSNALILPSDPQQLDVTQAVSGTGDIFVTGSMKLSRTLSTTGGSDERYDHPDLDRLYDVAPDEDDAAIGVQPVRAAKAVSTGPNTPVVTSTSRRGNVLPTVLAVVAGALAVGVVTLLVGSWLLRLF